MWLPLRYTFLQEVKVMAAHFMGPLRVFPKSVTVNTTTPKQYDANSFLLCLFQYYPLEEVLAAEYLLEDFRPDLIEMVLDKLRPEHVRSV